MLNLIKKKKNYSAYDIIICVVIGFEKWEVGCGCGCGCGYAPLKRLPCMNIKNLS